MQQETSQDVGVVPRMHAEQSAGLVEMDVGTVEALEALPEQARPTGAAYPIGPPLHVQAAIRVVKA